MIPDAYFSPDYATARQRFRDAAGAAGWRLVSRQVDTKGPLGETLSIDGAVSPSVGRSTLVVSSGLHGVEGFFGSAVQLALLERWRTKELGVRCVFLHALNPFGFAWLRRVDERNVDLNRNFLLPGDAYTGSPPGYADLDRVLNPSSRASRWDPFLLQIAAAVVRRGLPAVRRAIAVGQYDFPRGLFYGGAGSSPARTAVESVLRDWLGPADRIVHVDIHTGLGRRGEPVLLIDYDTTAEQRHRLATSFKAGEFYTPEASDMAYMARGGLGRWCTSSGLARDYLFAFLEVGTFSGVKVLAGLRAENRARHWTEPDSSDARRAAAKLRELFCPSDPRWRSEALARTVDVIERAAKMCPATIP